MANDVDSSSERAGQALRGLFQSVNLFQGFPDSLVDDLKKATSIVNVDPENTILRQGEVNKNLYFLLIGTVDIFVDNGHVASLRRKGDLLGEMSVITNKPCSATIVAKTPCELICINTEEFRKLTGNNNDQFDRVLYRIYSVILTDKINITNQKAKRLEDTMEALTRAKNDLIEINNQMERRLAERTQSLQAQLDELLNKKLTSLSTALTDAQKQSTGDLQLKISRALSGVQDVSKAIEPIVQAFNLEISLKNKHILLAQAEKKSQTMVKMALGGTGVQIETASGIDDAISQLQTKKIDLVMVDIAGVDLIRKLKTLNITTPVVLILSDAIREQVSLLATLPTVPSLVTIHEADRVGSVREISTCVSKLLSPHIFGLEKHLGVGVQVQELPVKRSDERQQLIQKMRDYFTNLGIRGSVLDAAGMVTEEILMNAIYDAPVDPSGKHIYNNLPRTSLVELKKDEEARMRFACDGTLVAVSVEDPFGALSPDILIRYLETCYAGKEGTLQEDKGGAGRGLHQIVEGSEFVVFNVRPKRRTEVIAFFNMIPGAKEVRAPRIQYCIQK